MLSSRLLRGFMLTRALLIAAFIRALFLYYYDVPFLLLFFSFSFLSYPLLRRPPCLLSFNLSHTSPFSLLSLSYVLFLLSYLFFLYVYITVTIFYASLEILYHTILLTTPPRQHARERSETARHAQGNGL